MQQQIEKDLKTGLLRGDKTTVETLRGIKSALLNETISLGAKERGLTDEEAQRVLAREAKKRTEAAELYAKAGETARAETELTEKKVIEQYLPAQASEAEVKVAVDEEITKAGELSMADMGKIIGAVRAKLGAGADGGLIARLVKEAIEK